MDGTGHMADILMTLWHSVSIQVCHNHNEELDADTENSTVLSQCSKSWHIAPPYFPETVLQEATQVPL